jgi:hypothetical protein
MTEPTTDRSYHRAIIAAAIIGAMAVVTADSFNELQVIIP